MINEIAMWPSLKYPNSSVSYVVKENLFELFLWVWFTNSTGDTSGKMASRPRTRATKVTSS
jgi:hypothetical protein